MPQRDLTLTAELIAAAHPRRPADDTAAMPLMTDADVEAALHSELDARPAPAGGGPWVFGYGSLIWQPEFAIAEQRLGRVRGWHRRFCLLQRRFRGSTDYPGLVLALVAGGVCDGVAFRLPEGDWREVLMPVWRREMRGNGYRARWVPVATREGVVEALTFVANPACDRYTGRLGEADIADLIARADGGLGPSAEYLRRTALACAELGIRDRHLWSLQALVAERLQATPLIARSA
ncbi:gamma-glutamylcyclotransferase [Methylobacterium sp. Leaf466]|uniref:gamma-glutamylcyclotransferase n=1 Tax=Methylobacterium sp. Leaf466 TaxID=1736386 RepID=UPI0006F5C056|nr:gamma-glutamylcyclotransferase [Methylobacterium sp. Leaf466]KQT85689.1 calcium transporter ChaC [Methylobacterium sp. Leaf466]